MLVRTGDGTPVVAEAGTARAETGSIWRNPAFGHLSSQFEERRLVANGASPSAPR